MFVFTHVCSHLYRFVLPCTHWFSLKVMCSFLLVRVTCFILAHLRSFSLVRIHFQLYTFIFACMHSFSCVRIRFHLYVISFSLVRHLPVSRARSLVAPVLSRSFSPLAPIQPHEAALARALFDTVHSLLQHWSNTLDLSRCLSCAISLPPCDAPSLVYHPPRPMQCAVSRARVPRLLLRLSCSLSRGAYSRARRRHDDDDSTTRLDTTTTTQQLSRTVSHVPSFSCTPSSLAPSLDSSFVFACAVSRTVSHAPSFSCTPSPLAPSLLLACAVSCLISRAPSLVLTTCRTVFHASECLCT